MIRRVGILVPLASRGSWIRVMVCQDCGAVVHQVKGSEHQDDNGDTRWQIEGALPCVCPFCGQPFLVTYTSDEQSNRQVAVFRHIDLCSGLCTARWTGVWYLPWTWFSFTAEWELKYIDAIEDKTVRPPPVLDRIAKGMLGGTKEGEA